MTLNKAVSGGLKVTPGFTDVTAAKGTDYTENTTALDVRGQRRARTQTFTVSTTEDTTTEHHETFTVSLAVTGTSAAVDGDGHGEGDDHGTTTGRWRR